VDLRLTSISQTNAERSDLIEESGVHLLFKEWHEIPRSVSQIAEALKSQAQVTQRLGDVWWLKSREGQSGEKVFQGRLFYKAVYAHLECLTGEQVGGFSLRCGTSRLFNDKLIVKQSAHPLDPLCDAGAMFLERPSSGQLPCWFRALLQLRHTSDILAESISGTEPDGIS
jgi:hypothetical protein